MNAGIFTATIALHRYTTLYSFIICDACVYVKCTWVFTFCSFGNRAYFWKLVFWVRMAREGRMLTLRRVCDRMCWAVEVLQSQMSMYTTLKWHTKQHIHSNGCLRGGHNGGGRPHATEFVCNSLFFVVRYLFLRQTSVFSIYIRTKKSISSRFFHAEEDTTKTQQKNKRTNNDNNNEKTRFMDGRNPYLLR